MDKLFHFGTIDIDSLQQAWADFFALPFPASTADEVLGDLFAELVLIDDGIAGAVTQLLNGRKINREWLLVDEDYNSRLEAVKPQDPEALKEWQAMKSYKQELDKLAKMALAYYDQKYGKA